MSEHRAIEYVVEPTGYADLVHSDKYIWTLRVADRGTGWAIVNVGRCLNKRGEWEYESLSSNRTQAFLRRCRWDNLDDALAVAHDLIDSFRVNGLTAQEASDSVAARLAAEDGAT